MGYRAFGRLCALPIYYASLNNKNIAEPLVLSEILNLQMSLFHVRPLSEKWSMMASVGVGVYTDDTRFSRLRFRNVLGSAGLVFVRRILPNLELGAGLALNNAFGYPMALPALYRSASVSLRKWVDRWL